MTKPWLSNSGKLVEIAGHKANSLAQNLNELKVQSLVLASLVLVASRIFVANVSAIKAKGTPEGPYRYRESIRTDIREIFGWTAGFVVLRQIQKGFSYGLQKTLGIKETDNPNTYRMGQALKAWFKNPADAVKKFEHDLIPDLTPTVDIKNENAKKLMAWLKPKSVNPEAFLQQFYKLAPIGLASIPTVMLAGFALEKFTRDHSDHVVDFISKHAGSSAKPTGCMGSHPQRVATPAMPMPGIPFQGRPQPFVTHFAGATPVSKLPQPFPAARPVSPFSLGISNR